MLTTRMADTANDWPALFAGACAFAAESGLADFLPDDVASFEEQVRKVLSLPVVEVILAESDGEVVGGIGLAFGPYLWNPNHSMVEELFLWTAPGAPKTAALRLIRAAQSRAREKGATIQSFKSLNTSPPKIVSVYRAMGMRPVELTYLGKL